METLYVIGNGFDLHHGLDTSYESFGEFLKQADKELHALLNYYFHLSSFNKESPWSDFESKLANFDFEEAMNEFSDRDVCVSAKDFRDRDWHTYEQEVIRLVDRLTSGIKDAFERFILNVKFPDKIEDKRIRISPHALFLNFNYTDTLERYYAIKKENLLYIHNRAGDTSGVILGHGTLPGDISTEGENEEQEPSNLSAEEMEQWLEWKSGQYDYSVESAKSAAISYYEKSFKNTESILSENSDFFEKIGSVSNVTVLGHSMSNVDWEYFSKIAASASDSCRWVITSHGSQEAEMVKKALSLGIPATQIRMTRITEI